MNTIRIIAIALPMMILMACGGGGGGGTAAATMPPTNMPTPPTDNIPPDDMMPPTDNTPLPPTFMSATLPAYAIPNLTTARTAVGGTAPATARNESQIVAEIQTRATAADYFVFSDNLVGMAGTDPVSVEGETDDRQYSAMVPDVGELTFSLTGIADLSLVDETNFNFETQSVMDEGEATMIQSRSAAEQSDGTRLSFQTYGGWLDNSVFGVVFLDVLESGETTSRFASFSFGKESGSRPTGSGLSLTWEGVMIGTTGTGDFIQSDVGVTYVTATAGVLEQITFSNAKNLNTGIAVTLGGLSTLSFGNIPLMTDGSFALASGDIKGSFYGDNHEQIGGVFNHRTRNVTGAFGGVKQ